MARGKQFLHYTLGCNEGEFAVDLGDQVEFKWAWAGPRTHCGTVTAIYPRKKQVRVRYEDQEDWTKKTAEPKKKVAVVPIAHVDFIARDM